MINTILIFIVLMSGGCVDLDKDIKTQSVKITPEYLEKLDTLDPLESALEIYEGITNPIGVDDGMEPIKCEVYLMAKNADNTKLYIRTSFNHKNISHPYITLDIMPDKLKHIGVASNNSDSMMVTLYEKKNYRSISSVKLKWTHSSHFHYSSCFRLGLTKRRQ